MATPDATSSISSTASDWINAFKQLSDFTTTFGAALEEMGWLFHKEPVKLPKRLRYSTAHAKYETPRPRKGIVFTDQFKGIRYSIGNKTC